MADLPGRIVYVDDDFDVRQIVRAAFENYDKDKKVVMATCGGGQELISRLRELQPGLILLDLHMPEMNGPDTVDALREHEDGKDIPIIFLTGKKKVVMEDHYRNLGVIGIIYKPFDSDTLPQDVFKLWQDAFGESGGDSDGRVLSDLMDEENTDTFSEDSASHKSG